MSSFLHTQLNWSMSKGYRLGCLAGLCILSADFIYMWAGMFFFSFPCPVHFLPSFLNCVLQKGLNPVVQGWLCVFLVDLKDNDGVNSCRSQLSIIKKRILCHHVSLILSFHFHLFIPSSPLIYLPLPPPSADVHTDVPESSLNHSLTERGKERGYGER